MFTVMIFVLCKMSPCLNGCYTCDVFFVAVSGLYTCDLFIVAVSGLYVHVHVIYLL